MIQNQSLFLRMLLTFQLFSNASLVFSNNEACRFVWQSIKNQEAADLAALYLERFTGTALVENPEQNIHLSSPIQ